MGKAGYHLYAGITIVCWSLAYVMTKIAMAYLTGPTLAFLRYFLAFLAVAVFAVVYKMSVPKRRDWMWFLLAGFFGFAFYTIIFNKGTAMVTSATSSLISATVPVMTAFLASVVYKERLKAYQWSAIFVELCGIGLLTLWNGALSVNTGILWLLLAAFSFSIYNLCQRLLLKAYPAMQCAAYSMFAAMLWLLPWSGQAAKLIVKADAKVIAAVLVLVLFSSVLANICWSKALSLAEKTSYVANYMFVTPFLAALWGWLLLKEIPDWGTLTGGLVIFGGLLLFNKNSLAEIFHGFKEK